MKTKTPKPRNWSEEYRLQQFEIAKRLLREKRNEIYFKRMNTVEKLFQLKRAGKLRKDGQYNKPHIVYPLKLKYAPYQVVSTGTNGLASTYDVATVDPSNLSLYRAYTDHSISINTPNFHTVGKRPKLLPDHTFGAAHASYSDTPYSRTSVSPDGWTYTESAPHCCHIDWFQPSQLGTSQRNECKAVAHNRLHARVNKMHVNVGQMFAERKQTVGLIVNASNRLVSAARALRHADWRSFEKALSLEVLGRHHGKGNPNLERTFQKVAKTAPEKRLANHWLEYTFGWTPLLSDIYGSAELLASHAAGDLYHEKATASCRMKLKKTWTDANQVKYYLNVDSVYKYVVKYRLDSYARAALSQTGLDNPLLLAWELLPYSFVVDWFYNVSGYLKKLNTFDGFQLVSGTESFLENFGMTNLLSRTVRYGPNNYYVVSGAQSFKESLYNRDVMSSWPANIPPTLRNPLENGPIWKVATSAALLRQLFK